MKKILLGLSLILVSLQAQIVDTKQLLVVSTKSWSSSNGTLQRYKKVEKTWQKVGTSIHVKLGRNGLGWGIGLHTTPKNAKYIKKEGDGKAPAGIFRLKNAYGYAPYAIGYPYKVYKTTDHCVDDINSKFYNKIVDSRKIVVDYKSHERMKLKTNYYKYGIVVDHNGITKGANSKRGAGSCIFIHIKHKTTSGCTVMKEYEIKEVLKWLDEKSNPLLVQAREVDISTLLSTID